MKFVKFIKFSTGIVFVCVLVGIISSAAAQICLKSDCEALGYNKTVADCTDHFDILRCPFDSNKVVCGGEVIYTGVNQFYYNGTKLGVIQGVVSGGSYTAAESLCSSKGYRLPTYNEATRIHTLSTQGLFTGLTIVVSGGGSGGLWTNESCAAGQHKVRYMYPQCTSDSTLLSTSVCVKEMD